MQATTDSRIAPLLEKIVADRDYHAKWLNLVSFMENTGTTKIYRSMSPSEFDQTILQHAAEESRHALFFKNQLTRIYGNVCSDYSDKSMLAKKPAFGYFQRLDAMVRKKTAGNKYLNYLYVTMLIEERASKVYVIYEDLLSRYVPELSLKNVLKEEEGHLEFTVREIRKNDEKFDMHIAEMREKEELLFDRFWSTLEKLI